MKLKETTNEIPANLDPRLQRVIAFNQSEHKEAHPHLFNAESAETADAREIAVIAKVKDIEAWKNLSGVRQIADLGSVPEEQKNVRLVTARIAADQIEQIRKSPAVMSLKASQLLKPQLFKTIEETKARADLLNQNTKSNGGKGVVIGIVDDGCDFTHKNFIHSDGTSRILSYWDQTAIASSDTEFGYGKVYSQEQLSRALQTDAPFAALHLPDPKDDIEDWHGTHVMDTAAGNGNGTNTPGPAPQADIVFVQLNAEDVPWSGPDAVKGDFGSSVHLLEALQYIYKLAGDRPCVTNISLGTNGGPHDGTSLVEVGFDTLLSAANNRAIVLAASNSYTDGIHASGTIRQNEVKDLSWIVEKSDRTSNEIELWYDAEDEFSCQLITPDGQNLGEVKLGTTHQAVGNRNEILIFISHRKQDPNNGDNVINIFMERGLPAGAWTLRLRGEKIRSGKYHAWIERDDFGQSHFEEPLDNTHTLGSICCGKKTVVVGSYSAKEAGTPLSFFSSAGPTRDGRQKPEISAPGGNETQDEPVKFKVMAAKSGSIDGVTPMMGTSMAAPAVTGIIALMLAEALAHGISLSSEEIHEILRKSARPMSGSWHDRYGFGRIDAAKAVQLVGELTPVH
ncbi:S8 family serine peptidase [Paenibacillus sp. LMG 31459]|uniref:S8 family serine peptidase n=1 Tax=Paenibacillus phytohabitans TaxID=2654978 RepID=A0ABX1YJU3_9BACL|nr:S8 family peptidase [Paenibacillus phytohabitans]NOU81317.1 S8 family serine peptidase [Paenibacillus phytohabitans]